MNSIKLLDRRVGYFAMAMALLLAFTLPTFVGAAQVTERSIALSSSSKATPGVTYEVNFKTAIGAANAEAFVVDFCQNSPLVGQACTPPVGFNATAAASAEVGFTDVTATASKIVVTATDPMAANTQVSVPLTGITNPTEAGTIYARILTFASAALADAYTSEVPGTSIDQGGLAISITDTSSVSGAVLESMQFCIARVEITANCANAAANPPTLKLGQGTGDVLALSSSAISTGNIYTQISTNAVGGAIVSIKSATSCGGLKRLNASVCDIAATGASDFTAGQAKFGVKIGAVSDTGPVGDVIGTYQPAGSSIYTTGAYAFNYDNTNATGVTSTFGDPILDTDGAPVNGKNIPLIFGASVTNNTPAGLYSTDLSLIATGKF
ncbi:hypothetical protein A2791_04100 [Candidatus Saccharibacteria bacterium RIFCSPHIGHO2_01_FULL_46_30]|nr:MAG: hypothetical protein A2791_04100 [Candidatus Saccharibacteria bacterium RIFCSPHIGHO2_01_FULL_46_30]